MNDENLKKGEEYKFQSGEKAARNGRKGGIASGVSKRKKKTFREMTKNVMMTRVANEKIADKLERDGFEPTYAGMMLHDMIGRAGKNANIAKILLELLGEIGDNAVTINNTNVQGEPVKIYLPDNKRND